MNWMKYKNIYFLFSGILMAVSIYSLSTWGLNLGVDFTGGSVIEYSLPDGSTRVVREGVMDETRKSEIKATLEGEVGGEVTELRFENVGPAIGPELVKKTITAVSMASLAILIWVAIAFKSVKFGTSAVLAMFHDSFILVGLYSLLGHFFGAEVDFLFVTAGLTILSFSVHDTIVVFDRIRELKKLKGGEVSTLADSAISQTMVRSINNSLTIIFMLSSLVIFGGESIKWFAASLLIGTILGTYSSPFVAVPLLVVWEKLKKS